MQFQTISVVPAFFCFLLRSCDYGLTPPFAQSIGAVPQPFLCLFVVVFFFFPCAFFSHNAEWTSWRIYQIMLCMCGFIQWSAVNLGIKYRHVAPSPTAPWASFPHSPPLSSHVFSAHPSFQLLCQATGNSPSRTFFLSGLPHIGTTHSLVSANMSLCRETVSDWPSKVALRQFAWFCSLFSS